MRNITDLEAVKSVARSFVYTDVHIDSRTGFIVSHPFIETVACAVKKDGKFALMDVRKPDELQEIRKSILADIERVANYQQFTIIVRPAYMPAFFKYTMKHLSSKDYAEFLSSMWTRMELPNVDVNITAPEFIKIFREADKAVLMDEDEYKDYEALPEEFTVYRGIRGRGSLQALSWTLDKSKAERFANRWDKNGRVYSARIYKKDTFAYFSSRSESEIVLDYTKLKDISLEEKE